MSCYLLTLASMVVDIGDCENNWRCAVALLASFSPHSLTMAAADRIRLTVQQQDVLVSWVEEEANYKLLYDHGSTKGVSNLQAFSAMSEFFKKTMGERPDLLKKLDITAIDATFIERRWKGIMGTYEGVTLKKTGNGANDPAKKISRCRFQDRLDCIFKDNPRYDPSCVRNAGMVIGKAR